MEDKKNKNIIVIYIGIKNIPNEMWNDYMEKVKNAFSQELKNEDDTYMFIPSMERVDTEVICINPKYITEKELIKEHDRNMKNLNNKLLELIKKEQKDGK